MKTLLPLAVLCTTLAAGCVYDRRPVVVTTTPAPAVYQPGYVATSLPTGYRTVRVNRTTYYVDRDTYYRPHQRGYVVVARP
jgi:hypothetical protein